MYRIGIIGSDNSHADAFSQLVNIPDPKTGKFRYPDCKVVSIFGLDKEHTEEVAKGGRIEKIVEKPEDMLGNIDAAMVVFRHGDLHLQYAKPFIEAGIPTWVDKPFTIKTEEAKELIRLADEHNTLVTGGSTCKFVYDVLALKAEMEDGTRIGKLKSAVINFPAELTNEYGGLPFYGAHLAEMTLAGFGYNPKSVMATVEGENVIAIVKYDDFQVIMNFVRTDVAEYFAVLYGDKGTIVRELDISICYKMGFNKYVEMLRTKKRPIELSKIYAAVELISDIQKSYKTGKEVKIEL